MIGILNYKYLSNPIYYNDISLLILKEYFPQALSSLDYESFKKIMYLTIPNLFKPIATII